MSGVIDAAETFAWEAFLDIERDGSVLWIVMHMDYKLKRLTEAERAAVEECVESAWRNGFRAAGKRNVYSARSTG